MLGFINRKIPHLQFKRFHIRSLSNSSTTSTKSRKSTAKESMGVLPLDATLYKLDEDQQTFLKEIIGIETDEELKEHIINVQTKLYEICPYPCIRYFTFVQPTILRLPKYRDMIEICKVREEALFLDIGCCCGGDLRRAISDGWPAKNIISSDVQSAFWEGGHELFRTTPSTFPVAFVPGDAFDSALIACEEPLYSPPTTPKPTSLQSLTSLNPLRGHLSVIHASLLIHLFNEEKQLDISRRLAGLLSPEPGSMILGSQYGRPNKGVTNEILADGLRREQFWHSPESWKELWEKVIFKEGTVKVEVEWNVDELQLMKFKETNDFYYMKWSVTRL